MADVQPIITAATQLLNEWQGAAAGVLLMHFLTMPGISDSDAADARALLEYLQGGHYATAHLRHTEALQAKADAVQLLAQQRAEKKQHSAARRERKTFIRAEVAALLKTGATHKEIRQRLNATGWEISHAINWNEAHGVDMTRAPETIKPYAR